MECLKLKFKFEVKYDELKDFGDKSELEKYESDNTYEKVWVCSLASKTLSSSSSLTSVGSDVLQTV